MGNLLYLPTIIGIIMKYGPYLSTAEAVLKQLGPLAQEVAEALSPIVKKAAGDLDLNTPGDIISGVQTVLESIGHAPMSQDEQDVLSNRLSAMA